MSQRLLIIFLLLVLGAVSGAFGYSLWAQERLDRELVAARAEGRAEAEKAIAAELEALKPVVLTEAPEAEKKADGTHFSYEYVAPKNPELEPFHQLAQERDLLRQLPEIQAIDGLLTLPRAISFVTAECREPNAFYSPERSEVVMCYETMKVLLERGQALAADATAGDEASDDGEPGDVVLSDEAPAEAEPGNAVLSDEAPADDLAQRYLEANLRFILLHETGHALIDLLEIPITGREEDAVDQLATTLMQRFAGSNESSGQVTENLRMAANWFLMRSTGQYNLDAYADEHALGEQRYFNLQCLLYGSDPSRYLEIVTSGDLPEERAKGCPAEARRVSKSWLRLLLPHVAPKFAMTEEKANRLFEQRERERNRNAEAPYVR